MAAARPTTHLFVRTNPVENLARRSTEKRTFLLLKSTTADALEKSIKNDYGLSEHDIIQPRIFDSAANLADIVGLLVVYMEGGDMPFLDVLEETPGRWVVEIQVSVAMVDTTPRVVLSSDLDIGSAA
jgi:hypothetical protein